MTDKEEEEKGGQVITPWEAKAGEGQATIDYDKLISKLIVVSSKQTIWVANFNLRASASMIEQQ